MDYPKPEPRFVVAPDPDEEFQKGLAQHIAFAITSIGTSGDGGVNIADVLMRIARGVERVADALEARPMSPMSLYAREDPLPENPRAREDGA